jgi:hypothetical protein
MSFFVKVGKMYRIISDSTFGTARVECISECPSSAGDSMQEALCIVVERRPNDCFQSRYVFLRHDSSLPAQFNLCYIGQLYEANCDRKKATHWDKGAFFEDGPLSGWSPFGAKSITNMQFDDRRPGCLVAVLPNLGWIKRVARRFPAFWRIIT